MTITITLATLIVTGCGTQQPASEVSATPLVEPSASRVESSPSAPSSTPDPAPGTSSQSAAVLPQEPRIGLPSSDFCEAAEIYLSRFEGLPLTDGAPVQDPLVAANCTYTEPELSVEIASLVAIRPGAGSEFAEVKQVCDGERMMPADATRLDAPWVQSRGWSGWTATSGSAQLATLCTDEHYYTASIIAVPEAMPEDALKTILCGID